MLFHQATDFANKLNRFAVSKIVSLIDDRWNDAMVQADCINWTRGFEFASKRDQQPPVMSVVNGLEPTMLISSGSFAQPRGE